MKIIALFALFISSLSATINKQHGLSVFGETKYGKNFKHFNYVNPKAPKGGHFRYGVIGNFDSLNPFIVMGTPVTGLQIYCHANLLSESQDEVGATYAYVAESVSINSDRSVVTFYIRKAATFDNGTPIEAKDVEFSFNSLRGKGNPMLRSYYKLIKEVKVLDTNTIQFTLTKAGQKSREMPLVLGQLPILSRNAYKGTDFDKNHQRRPVCSGPYRVKDVDFGRKITFERRKKWWGKNIPSMKGRFNFDHITFDYFKDPNALFEIFKKGDLDLRVEGNISKWKTRYDFDAVEEGRIKKLQFFHKLPGISTGLAFNTQHELFKDIRVRKALTLVFPFERVNEKYFHNEYKRSHSYFPNGDLVNKGKLTKAQHRLMKKYTKDSLYKKAYKLPKNKTHDDLRASLTKAQKLLEEAGWDIDSKTKVLKHLKTGKTFEFDFYFSDPKFKSIYLEYVRVLKRLGITMTLRLLDNNAYQTILDKNDYAMVRLSIPQSSMPGNEQRTFFGSATADKPGTLNRSHIKNEVVDAIIKDLEQSKTYEELKNYTTLLDRILMHNYYMVPFWHNNHFNVAVASNIHFPKVHPKYDYLPFNNAWMETKAPSKTKTSNWFKALWNKFKNFLS